MGKASKKPPVSMIPVGTGVVVFSPEHLKGVRGDIVSFDKKTGGYKVQLRGAAASSLVVIGREEFSVIDENAIDQLECRGNESHRKVLFELASNEDPPGYIQDRVAAIKIADEICYTVMTNPGRMDPEFTFQQHIPIVQQYYLSNTWSWPLPTPVCASLMLSLKMYVDESAVDPFHISSFKERLSTAVDKSSDYEDAVNLLFGSVVYALLGHVGTNHKTEKQLASQVDALWAAFELLKSEKESSEQVRQAVNQRFAAASEDKEETTIDVVFTHEHLLWCICCLNIQRCKDLRIHCPHEESYKAPATIDRLVLCAETAIRSRPDSPHSYFMAAYLLSDTQEMCRPSDGPKRYPIAYGHAIRGLAVAEEYKDPFYLYQCHVLVAYWKMTSAHMPRPLTQKDIQHHLELGEEYKVACRLYTPSFDLHRASQTKRNVQSSLKAFQRINPTYNEDDVLPGFISVAPWEQQQQAGNDSSRTVPGTEEGGKLDLHASKYHCRNCNKVLIGKLRTCTRCGRVSYCGRDCQREHWKKKPGGHKEECKQKKK